MYGLRAAALVSVLAFWVNITLVQFVSEATVIDWFRDGGLLGSAAVLLTASAVGRLHDLGDSFHRELELRKVVVVAGWGSDPQWTHAVVR